MVENDSNKDGNPLNPLSFSLFSSRLEIWHMSTRAYFSAQLQPIIITIIHSVSWIFYLSFSTITTHPTWIENENLDHLISLELWSTNNFLHGFLVDLVVTMLWDVAKVLWNYFWFHFVKIKCHSIISCHFNEKRFWCLLVMMLNKDDRKLNESFHFILLVEVLWLFELLRFFLIIE